MGVNKPANQWDKVYYVSKNHTVLEEENAIQFDLDCFKESTNELIHSYGEVKISFPLLGVLMAGNPHSRPAMMQELGLIFQDFM